MKKEERKLKKGQQNYRDVENIEEENKFKMEAIRKLLSSRTVVVG